MDSWLESYDVRWLQCGGLMWFGEAGNKWLQLKWIYIWDLSQPVLQQKHRVLFNGLRTKSKSPCCFMLLFHGDHGKNPICPLISSAQVGRGPDTLRPDQRWRKQPVTELHVPPPTDLKNGLPQIIQLKRTRHLKVLQWENLYVVIRTEASLTLVWCQYVSF